MGFLSESLGAQVGSCVDARVEAPPVQNLQLITLRVRVNLVYSCYLSSGEGKVCL